MFLWRALVWLFTQAEPCTACCGLDSLYDEHFVCDTCFNTGYVIPGEEANVH